MYYIWPFDGTLTAHPNSLLFNALPLYWPFKAFWFFRKVSPTLPVRYVSASHTLLYCLNSSARSSLFKTSPSLQRTILTFRDLANTSPFLSSTESPNREQKREQGPLSEIRHRTERSRIGSAAGKASLHLSTSSHQLFKRDSPL